MSDAINGQNSSIFKRVSSLILVVCSVAIAINLYVMHSSNARQWYEIESEQLGRSLTIQAAKLLSQPLLSQDETIINAYIDLLNEGMFIEGASVYDDAGVNIYNTNPELSIVNMISERELEPLIFIEDITHAGKTLGYVKLLLNHEEITSHHRSFNQSQLVQTVFITILGMIVATLATRLFYSVKRSYTGEFTENKLK